MERRGGEGRGEEDAVEGKGRYFYVRRGTLRSTREGPRDTSACLAVKVLCRGFFAGLFVLGGGGGSNTVRTPTSMS